MAVAEVFGNLSGISPNARKALERIYRRRVPLDAITTPELVRSLVDATRLVKRQVGALVHRSGTIDTVIVGSATGLMLPDIGRLRAAQGRFRALRLIHTHLFAEALSRDDLVDLTRLRLDLVCAIQLKPDGEPLSMSWAYNTPNSRKATSVHEASGYEVVGPQPYGQPQPNFGQLIHSLEDEFDRVAKTRAVHQERAMLIHVGEKRRASAMARARSSLVELRSLAETAGVSVVDEIVQLRDKPNAKLVVGKGKLDDILLRAIDLDIDVLIFDRELSGAQSSSIAASTDLRVIDRSQLILDIFAQNAETRDGKLQVELAQLKYRLPRLGQKDDALSRLTGGIGGRGPGETKLEIGRRRARERVTRLERQLSSLASKRDQLRRRRVESPLAIVALVGYTNAGKSTLLNQLTGAGVLAEDKLFATLDPRARRLRLPSGSHVILTDTVGFIRDMPKDLFAAFKATFEEALDADLLVHVVDIANVDSREQENATAQLLVQLDLAQKPCLTVLNKADKLPAAMSTAENRESLGGNIVVSAKTGIGIDALLTRIEQLVAPPASSTSAAPGLESTSSSLDSAQSTSVDP